MKVKILAGIALLGGAVPILAAPPAPAPDAGNQEKLVCKRISDNPSDRLAPRRKVCMTKAEWKEARRNQKVEMPEQRSVPSRY